MARTSGTCSKVRLGAGGGSTVWATAVSAAERQYLKVLHERIAEGSIVGFHGIDLVTREAAQFGPAGPVCHCHQSLIARRAPSYVHVIPTVRFHKKALVPLILSDIGHRNVVGVLHWVFAVSSPGLRRVEY